VHQERECVSAPLAGELSGKVGINNRASVHDLDRGLKNVYAFEKERPLLFVENRKALICSHHKLIGFDLREVGVQRHIERHPLESESFAVNPGSTCRG